MSRYLVTGGGGFIGSNLVEALLVRGDTVRVLDDFSTGHRENLAPWSGQIEVLEGSITDLGLCRRAVSSMDFVLHQAALPSVPRSISDPVATNAVNVAGTLNLLVASRDENVKRFVFASSSSVYGDTPALPKKEDMPTRPLSPYAVSKLTGEYYCENFFRLFGLPTVVLRYFNVFGPRQDPASQYAAVIPRFIAALLGGNAPTIYGSGEQTRDFTYVENAVAANILACEAPKEAFGRVFNCACGLRISLLELVRELHQLTGMKIKPIHAPPRHGEVQHSLADISQAAQLLKYSPAVDMREGLCRTVACFMQRRDQ
jgi:UDP-N-acetylglucosamine 4-epimerase